MKTAGKSLKRMDLTHGWSHVMQAALAVFERENGMNVTPLHRDSSVSLIFETQLFVELFKSRITAVTTLLRVETQSISCIAARAMSISQPKHHARPSLHQPTVL